MFSRRRSREFLLQSLYSRSELKSAFDRASFIDTYFAEDMAAPLEIEYIDTVEKELLAHEAELISLVTLLAPKFELPTLPVIHIMIIMIALTEILYTPSLAIPEAVAVNEAIELAKRFSDEPGKLFIN